MQKPPAHRQTNRTPIGAAESPEAADAADLAIVERIRSGDTTGWSSLIVRYQDRLYGVCLRMVRDRDLATDLTQDAFVKVIQGLHSYDGRAKLSTWMIRVTMNVCLSRLRSQKLRRHASLEGMAEQRRGGSDEGSGGLTAADQFAQNTEPDQVESVEFHEDKDRVLRALSTLDPDQRAVLILCDCRGLPYEQIAEVLGVAVGTVKSRLFRARAALREAVESMEGGSKASDEDDIDDR
ncbi:MAG: RNA polymerase sigma factor [Phycisphaerales bacterium]